MIASGSPPVEESTVVSASRPFRLDVPKHWDPAKDHSNFTRWANAMKAGCYQRAWKINLEHGKRWPSAHQLWDGEPLQGRFVRLYGLHGLGDVVQMARFLPRLRRLTAGVSCVVAPALVPLMSYFAGEAQVEDFKAFHYEEDRTDSHIEFMELLHVLNLTLEDLPVERNYLHLPHEMIAQTSSRMSSSSRPKIGLVWRGGPWDPDRWIPFSKLRGLVRLTEFEWWSMQSSEAALDARCEPVKRLDQLFPTGGLVELASALANLDVLITTDTLAAHLSAALGKTTWVLLKHDADWRWMEKVSYSPWYPSIRLFRQQIPGDWDSLIEQVQTALLNRPHSSAVGSIQVEV